MDGHFCNWFHDIYEIIHKKSAQQSISVHKQLIVFSDHWPYNIHHFHQYAFFIIKKSKKKKLLFS